MASYLIQNALVVNEGRQSHNDVYIQNGRIEKLGGNLSAKPGDRIIDANGRVLLPGMIDDQVHFREPGMTHKGDIFSESRAAVAGGITTFMEMPNTAPPSVTRALVEEKFAIASKNAFANYSFYLGGTNGNIEEIKALDPNRICGVKVFMGASTGNMLVDDPKVLEQIFTHSPTIVATHCEDTPEIEANTQKYQIIHGDHIPMALHPKIRSEQACYRSSALAVGLAKQCDTKLHLLHLSTAKELDLLSKLPLDQKKITAEVCVHHLFFSDADYNEKGAFIKCNPAIKTTHDRDSLNAALVAGKIDVIGTDHAPHTKAEKLQAYLKSPSGLPLVQHALITLLEKYHQGVFSLELIAEKTAHAPAKLFDIRERGFIREGYWADLVLVDLNKNFPVDEKPVYSKCGWTPFSKMTFQSSIMATFVSGHPAFMDEKIDPTPMGKRIEFDRR